jgi:hypothetical protein
VYAAPMTTTSRGFDCGVDGPGESSMTLIPDHASDFGFSCNA